MLDVEKMSERFEVTKYNVPDGKFGVIDTIQENEDEVLLTICDRESQARVIVEKMNELQHQVEERPFNLQNDFKEWDNLINWLNKTGRRITKIDEIYAEESKLVLRDAIENGVDFKALYGGNTEKTRRQYVDEQLADLLNEKKELKALQSDDLRRVEYLKRLIDMKVKLIGVDAK